jgi:hypothetical protein
MENVIQDNVDLARSGIVKLQRMITNNPFIGRCPQLVSMSAALLSRTNCVLYGPAGTAKSALARYFCDHLPGGSAFSLACSPGVGKEDIIGSPSIPAIADGRLEYLVDQGAGSRRIRVAFFDEFNRLSSGVYPALLQLMNERTVSRFPGSFERAGLHAVIGASNSVLPECVDPDMIEPLLSRWAIKCPTESLSAAHCLRFAARKDSSIVAKDQNVLTHEELDAAVSWVSSFGFGSSAWAKYSELCYDSVLKLTNRCISTVLKRVLSGYSAILGYSSISANAISWLKWSTLQNPEDPIEKGSHESFWANFGAKELSAIDVYHAAMQLSSECAKKTKVQAASLADACVGAANNLAKIGGPIHAAMAERCSKEAEAIYAASTSN